MPQTSLFGQTSQQPTPSLFGPSMGGPRPTSLFQSSAPSAFGGIASSQPLMGHLGHFLKQELIQVWDYRSHKDYLQVLHGAA